MRYLNRNMQRNLLLINKKTTLLNYFKQIDQIPFVSKYKLKPNLK